MSKYTITQVRSSIGLRKEVKACLLSLGLKKIGSTVTVSKRPETDGLLAKVAHLVKYEIVK